MDVLPTNNSLNEFPVRVSSSANAQFRVEAHSGGNGALKWMQSSDYVLPPHNWVPSYSPVLSETASTTIGSMGISPVAPGDTLNKGDDRTNDAIYLSATNTIVAAGAFQTPRRESVRA